MVSTYRIERDRGSKESRQQFAVLREKWPLAFPVKEQDVRPLAIGAAGEISQAAGETCGTQGCEESREARGAGRGEAGPCPHLATRDAGAIAHPSEGRALTPERIAAFTVARDNRIITCIEAANG
jgi:hypothetical protein